ncbi:Lipoprotein releasing system, transmembrane protein, LolC/E family [uncultured Desulfobacterium sp.]|uniref:Lipoprotein releasing system, transmembrane protein, LolC/E family n=1 Tax=uncultured Desulfobacterium sp. TaxID=201089 RepID=A0A445N0H1_9BACT|nr:Lipoprotein releasing system, transmembrane protein, LolC/E family [uncultured Desulfobacterium sp.]
MFEIFLGIRYLKAKRKQAFISIITIISALGVMMGVMALVVVLSVMNGFRADMMSKILGVNSHLLIMSYGGPFEGYQKVEKIISGMDGIVASTPFISSQVMFNNSGNVTGAIFWGINPETAGSVVDLKTMIKRGSLESLRRTADGVPAIIIGCELAKQTDSDIGDIVTVISPEGKLTPMGRIPNTRQFKVSGIFDSGMYEYDASMVYVSLEEAQDFLALGNRVSGLRVKIRNVFESEKVSAAVQEKLGHSFLTKDWKAMNKSLFAALKLEKYTMFVILAMIVMVGALNIISTLVMVVMEKTRDVAILRAMGASKKSIMSIFMLQGLLVGVVGTIAGILSGLGICELLAKYKFIDLDPSVYYIQKLPVLVEAGDVWVVSLAAVMISFLATIYPSWYASRMNPVEVIRYE